MYFPTAKTDYSRITEEKDVRNLFKTGVILAPVDNMVSSFIKSTLFVNNPHL